MDTEMFSRPDVEDAMPGGLQGLLDEFFPENQYPAARHWVSASLLRHARRSRPSPGCETDYRLSVIYETDYVFSLYDKASFWQAALEECGYTLH